MKRYKSVAFHKYAATKIFISFELQHCCKMTNLALSGLGFCHCKVFLPGQWKKTGNNWQKV